MMRTIEFRTQVKDGMIEIPAQYREQIKGQVRVALILEEEEPGQENLIDRLLKNPVQIQGFRSTKRENLHDR